MSISYSYGETTSICYSFVYYGDEFDRSTIFIERIKPLFYRLLRIIIVICLFAFFLEYLLPVVSTI